MYTKNLLQNGYKTTEGALATLVPFNKAPKKEINVEAQVDATNFMPMTDINLPSKISTAKGIMALSENNKGIEKYSKIAKDVNMINYKIKKAGSFDGVDVNFGVGLDDAIQFYIYLYESGYAKEDAQSTRQINNVLNVMAPELINYRKTGVVTPELNKLGNEFKTQLPAVLTEAQWVISGIFDNGSDTEIYKKIEEYKEPLIDLAKIYQYDGNTSAQYMSTKVSQAQQNLYNYVETISPYKTSRTSSNAKQRILNNSWYLSYVKSIKETSPELYDQLEMSASSPYITDLEAKVIGEINRHNAELEKQKELIEEEYGWTRMNEIFNAPKENGASLNDLLSLKWELYKNVVDDDIENSIKKTAPVTLDFDSYLDSTINYATPNKTTLDSSGASAIIGNMTGSEVNQMSNSPERISVGANMRFDKLTGKAVAMDYEHEKYLANLEGREQTLSNEQKQKINERLYTDIRNENLKKITNQ